jgi:hypothetical protein
METKTKAIVCANSVVYLGKRVTDSKTYCVAIRMNMRTQKYSHKWWYRYNNDDDGKIFFPNHEFVEYDICYSLYEQLTEKDFYRDFLFADVREMYREKKGRK